MAGYGDELRMERERHGISLDALSAETKINLRHLLSLEQGNFQELPGGVFRRGIVRAYLKAIEVDEEAWMVRFEDSAAEHARIHGLELKPAQNAWVEFAANVKKNRSTGRQPRDWRWFGVLVMLLLLALAASAVWKLQLVKLVRSGNF